MYQFSKYFWVLRTSLRSNFAYLSGVVGQLIFLIVILFIFMNLWQVTYSQSSSKLLAGFDVVQMLWYLAVTEAIIMSRPLLTAQVDEDVRTGAIAVQLTKPLSYPLYQLATTCGEQLVKFVINLLAGSLVVFCLIGPITVSLVGLAIFVAALPLAFALDFVASFLIGICAFWMEDTSGLNILYTRVTMILGGLLLPISLFPDWLRPIAQVLPFASIVYGPAHLFVHPNGNELVTLLIQQAVSLLILGGVVAIVYQRALRRIAANGG